VKKVLGVLVVAAMTAPVYAEDESGFYLGLTGGKDFISVEGFDDASGGGLMAGWNFNRNVAIEFAGHASDSKGDDLLPGCIFEIDTAALYLAGRSDGKFYGKGKIGVLSETIRGRDTCAFVEEESESGLSFGFGGGLRFGKAAVELEYTLVEADVRRLSVTMLYNF
jgi:hypothetical protein